MIFVPMSHREASALRDAGGTDQELRAFAATRQMITAHGYRPEEDEEADYAAQLYASVVALIDHPPDSTSAPVGDHQLTGDDRDARLVISAEVPAGRVRDAEADADHGAVLVRGLQWTETTAVFVDESAAAAAVGAAREAISAAADHRLSEILELPAVVALTEDHDLLWHLPAESW
jgi:hypothetical protein